MSSDAISTSLYPAGMLNVLSRNEVERLTDASQGNLSVLLRRCVLAVLNSGGTSDDAEALLEKHHDFRIVVEQVTRGLRLQLSNAPGSAFVDGRIIEGIRKQISSVIRDLVYFDCEIANNPRHDTSTGNGITHCVFEMLRNADSLIPQIDPDLVVCWGGHSIPEHEYNYTKNVGYQLGLRELNIITGCGPGAMKGPMKGATIGHSKQRTDRRRYIGISEPGIIAAESPNPIVSELIVMPDIEKRLEAFVRLGHGIVVFPGGVGTAEEILYLLGILLNPVNKGIPFPLVFTGPESAAPYFEKIDKFIHLALGDSARECYEIIIDDPESVARVMNNGLTDVRKYRIRHNDAFYFNWLLQIEASFQHPFLPSHDNMAALDISAGQPPHKLAAILRQAFSGIVAGNVKPGGLAAIREHGPYTIYGDPDIMAALDSLLADFVYQGRMKLPGGDTYKPCYRISTRS